jgi:cobalt-precorrin 5A hydrolase
MNDIAIYAVTQKGAWLGSRIKEAIGGELFIYRRHHEGPMGVVFDSIVDVVKENFYSFTSHVFIMATGIVVRAISGLINHKGVDPAVVVLDQEGRHVISLLSGHMGGANSLSRRIAEITGGEPVITTATDTEGLVSIDTLAFKRDLVIRNPSAIKRINSVMLEGKPLQVYDPDAWLDIQCHYKGIIMINDPFVWDRRIPGIWVTWKDEPGEDEKLVLHPRCLIAGIGCNRGASGDEIMALIRNTFKRHQISILTLKSLVSIEEKKNEKGLFKVAETLGIPLEFFCLSELLDVPVYSASEVVEKHMGVKCICEAVALKKASRGRLLIPKVKSKNVTLAVAIVC